MGQNISLAGWVAAGILFVAAFAAMLIYFDIHAYVLKLFEWMDQHRALAPLIFILVDMLVVVFVLPGVIITMGAGFLFGVIKGSLYVVIATTIGAAIAFLIARHLFGGRIKHYFMSHPRLGLVNNELSNEGWKIVFLTRLVPFFPFKLSNYFFGLTNFSLRGFFFGTMIGIIPITMINVYVGSLAADLAGLGPRGISRTPLEWAMYGIGLVVAIVTVIYITRRARKALQNYIPLDDQQ